jgi:hypothetical protein
MEKHETNVHKEEEIHTKTREIVVKVGRKRENSENHTLIANFDEMEGEGKGENEAVCKRKW